MVDAEQLLGIGAALAALSSPGEGDTDPDDGNGDGNGDTDTEPTGNASDRQYTYTFEPTGSQPVDYYLEVESGGEMIATRPADMPFSRFDILDNQSKAAGRAMPGETHQFAFDTIVLDAEPFGGQVNALVSGSPSNLSRYPLAGYSGDGWKDSDAFTWLDGGYPGTIDGGDPGGGDAGPANGSAVGGGDGYENTFTESDANFTVSDAGELVDALDNAGSGDVVFCTSDIDMTYTSGHVPGGVTLAGNRGVGGAAGPTLYNDDTDRNGFILTVDGEVAGLDLRGGQPGLNSGYGGMGLDLGPDAEVHNCEVREWNTYGMQAQSGGAPYIHHCVMHNQRGDGRGYSVSITDGYPVVERCYFEQGRHDVTTNGDPGTGWEIRYCHFGPLTHRWPVDFHAPDSDLAIVESCVFEGVHQQYSCDSDPYDCPPVHAIQIDVGSGVNLESSIRDNVFRHGSVSGALELRGVSWGDLNTSGNQFDVSNIDYSSVIPGYDGSWPDHTPDY